MNKSKRPNNWESALAAATSRLAEVGAAVTTRQPTWFWRQLVRSSDHGLDDYRTLKNRHGDQHFRGSQPEVDYSKPQELAYLEVCLDVRQALYAELTTLTAIDLARFGAMLVRFHDLMHQRLDYHPRHEWLHHTFTSSAHTPLVQQQVMPIARHYRDPYVTGKSCGPELPGIPAAGQPRDESDGQTITHHYPSLDFADAYLSQALTSLQKLPTLLADRNAYIHEVANILQYLNNLHLFAGINSSLYMNIANGLLEIAGITGIEHGIVDFVSMRLQPANFQQYFLDQVSKQK